MNGPHHAQMKFPTLISLRKTVSISCIFIFLYLFINFPAINNNVMQDIKYIRKLIHIKRPPDDDSKLILLYTPYLVFDKIWPILLSDILFGKCPESRCRFTQEKSRLPEADAVLFNAANIKNWTRKQLMDLSQSGRTPEQLWIFMSAESPDIKSKPLFFAELDGFFNLTMTYRRDSDIYYPYGGFMPRKDAPAEYLLDQPVEVKISLRKSSRSTIWMVSNCKTQSRREDFVKQLMKHLPVDIYGGCGKLSCFKPTTLPNLISHFDPCEKIVKSYYFYMALENSLCKDYVTEKLFRALKLGVVPVVMGGNYSDVAPPGSFINADDFGSTEELANYLKQLASDPNEYKKYLDWRKDYVVWLGHPYNPRTCNLCSKLHESSIPRKSYNLTQWFVEDSGCHAWTK